MKDAGCDEGTALDAAYRVYRFHHPLDTKEDSHLTVERWIYADQVH
jgi:hypothetical protein